MRNTRQHSSALIIRSNDIVEGRGAFQYRIVIRRVVGDRECSYCYCGINFDQSVALIEIELSAQI